VFVRAAQFHFGLSRAAIRSKKNEKLLLAQIYILDKSRENWVLFVSRCQILIELVKKERILMLKTSVFVTMRKREGRWKGKFYCMASSELCAIYQENLFSE
jgi:hypothetical protein